MEGMTNVLYTTYSMYVCMYNGKNSKAVQITLPRTNLAASTQKSVADFRKWWSWYMQPFAIVIYRLARSFNNEVLKLRSNRTPGSSPEKVETHEIELYLAFHIQKPLTFKNGGRLH